MDLRVYYQKIRKVESEIAAEFPVVVSRETSDGGKRGVKSQVPRFLAARLIAEDKADLASPEEAARFHSENAEAREQTRLQVEPPQPVRSMKPTGPKAGKKA